MSKIIYLHQQSKLTPFVGNYKTYDSTDLPGKNNIIVVPISTYIKSEERTALIKYAQQSDHHIYIEDCVEGSSTFIRHLDEYGLLKRALNKDISIIASGEMPEKMNAVAINYMMYMTGLSNENHRKISITKKKKPYTFLYLNNRIRSHRTHLLMEIKRLGLLDSALWCNVHNDELGHTLPKNKLPEAYDPQTGKALTDWNTWAAGPVIKKQYQDTSFSLVCESAVMHRYAFPTEKTWKPIIAGHPFMTLANARHYPYLKELGFQTFDSVLSEAWTGMNRWPDAIKWLGKQVFNTVQGDLTDFIAQCKPIVTHNKKQFWTLYDSYIADTQSKLNQLFEQVE